MYNVDGTNISPSEIVNIDYSKRRNRLNEEREIPKYVHSRLKCCDDRFPSNSQYIFHALDWIQSNAVVSSFWWKETISEWNQCRSISESQPWYLMIRFSPDLKTLQELPSTITICCWMALLKFGSLVLSFWLVVLLNSIGLKRFRFQLANIEK